MQEFEKTVPNSRKQELNIKLDIYYLGKEVTQPPLPPEVKRSNRLVPVAVVMLLIGVAIGVAVGWSIGQSRSQAVQSGYTRVKVLSGEAGSAQVQFGERPNTINYIFYYKSPHYDGNGGWINSYDPQTPISVVVSGYADHNLPATTGKTYEILGIDVVVSEVYNDYIILLVKPL